MYKEDKDQLQSAQELYERGRAILTEGCGVGKTVIALLASKKTGLPIYVCCPAGVKHNWENDAKMLGMDNIHVSSWASFIKNKKLWAKLPRGVFIVDEAHQIGDNAKDRDRAKAVILFSKKHTFCFLLSATPSKHRPLDFYWPLKLCGMHNFSREQFRLRYCGAFYHPTKRSKYGNPILLDGQPTRLPELLDIFERVKVENSKRKVTINKKFYMFPSTKLVDPLFSEISRLRKQVGEEKLVLFKRFVKGYELRDKPIIYFAYHRDIVMDLAKFLNAPYIIGGQSKKKRKEMLDKSLTRQAIVVSLRAGGQGINELKDFDTCYFVELSYSPATDMQAFMRMVRGRENKEINVNWIISKQEHTYLINKDKQRYFKEVINV